MAHGRSDPSSATLRHSGVGWISPLRRWWPFAVVAALLGRAAPPATPSLAVGQVEARPAAEPAQGAQEDFSEPVAADVQPAAGGRARRGRAPRAAGLARCRLAAVLCAAVVLAVVVGLVVWILVRDVPAPVRRQPVRYADEAGAGARRRRRWSPRSTPACRPLRHRRRPAPGGDRLLAAAGAGRGRGRHAPAGRRQPHRPGRPGCCTRTQVSADVLAGSPTSTARRATPPTPSTTGCAPRPGRRCSGSAPS